MANFSSLSRDEAIELLAKKQSTIVKHEATIAQQRSTITRLQKDNIYLEKQRLTNMSDTTDNDFATFAARNMAPEHTHQGLEKKVEELQVALARGSKGYNELAGIVIENKQKADYYEAKYNTFIKSTEGGAATNQHFSAGSSSNHYHDHRTVNNYYYPNPYNTTTPLVHRPKTTEAAKTTTMTKPKYSDDCVREKARKSCSHRTCPYFHKCQEAQYGDIRHTLPKNAAWARANGF